MPEETAPATPAAQPVTSQDVTAPAGSQDKLESQHSADTFKALSELFDASETTPPSPTPTTQATPPTPTPVGTETPPATPPTPQVDEFEKKLEGIELSPHAHPNQVKATDELRRISREEHKRAEELQLKIADYEKKVADYETKLKSPPLPEDVAKELEDLRTLRKELDMRLDPEFNKQYIKPVQDAEANIMQILTEAGLKQETAEFIKQHGGMVAMARSQDVIDSEKGLTSQQWINNVLLARTPDFHKNRVLGELTNALNIQDKAQRELTDFQGTAKQRWDAKMQQLTTDFNAGRDEAIAELGDIVKPKVAPATASAEERLAIEEHNTRLKQAEEEYNKLAQAAQNPKVAGAVLVKATQANVLHAWNKQLEKRIAELQSNLDRVTAAGSHSTAGSATPPPAATPAAPQPGQLLKIPDSKALGSLLDQVGILR